MKVYAHDIEIAPNLFTVTIVDYHNQDKVYQFEISERKNQYNLIYNFYVNNPMYLIGFNSKHFDDPIIFKLIKERSFVNADYKHITKSLYELGSYLIDNAPYEKWKEYKYPPYNVQIKQIDLFLYWTRLIRLTKKISLKAAAAFLDYENIQDLPFEPGTIIPNEDIDKILEYNLNDVKMTLHIAKHMRKDMILKFNVSKKYNKDYLSTDGVNMGLDVLKNEYCRITEEDPEFIIAPQSHPIVKLDELIHPKVSFNSGFKDILDEFRSTVITLNESNNFKPQSLFKGNMYVFGLGGLHTKDQPSVIRAAEDEIILAVDATSYYPHLTFVYEFFPKHLNAVFLSLYKDKYYTRVEAKKKSDIDSQMVNELYKLLLNGYTGSLKNIHSWVYDPIANLKITINGQLFMAMLAETFELNSIKVISANTDGVEIKFKKSMWNQVNDIIKWWEELIEIPLETEEYKFIVREDVNSYFALKTDGKVKEKGRLMTDPKLFFFHSRNNLVIPKAVQAYFTEGISPEEFITNHRNIYDFCSTPKVDKKKYTVYWNEQKQQNINRFYASKKGAYIYKLSKTTGKFENMVKGVAVQLFNDARGKDFPNDIDYHYYITKALEIIQTVDNPQQSLF